METKKTYDCFPVPVVSLAVLASISVYAIGTYILMGMGIWYALLFLLYCAWIEFRILKHSCVDCYYYGKLCGLGRGKLCSLLFKKGDPQRFVNSQISWKDLIPDFLVSIFPAIGAVILLIMDFSWLILLLLLILLALAFPGTAIIRGSFACKYCKQRDIGCSAEQLFNKQSKPAS